MERSEHIWDVLSSMVYDGQISDVDLVVVACEAVWDCESLDELDELGQRIANDVKTYAWSEDDKQALREEWLWHRRYFAGLTPGS